MEFTRFVVVAVVVLVLSSASPSNAATTPPSSGGGGDAHSMPCIQKLIPCQPYLHSAKPPPPPSCCVPLREIVDTDVKCLCSVFNNVDMLKSLNLTKENALVLPKACGANADISQCKATSGKTPPSSSTSPATPMTPPASSTGKGNSSTGDSASSTAKTSDSVQIINFAGFSFVSVIVSTLFF